MGMQGWVNLYFMCLQTPWPQGGEPGKKVKQCFGEQVPDTSHREQGDAINTLFKLILKRERQKLSYSP